MVADIEAYHGASRAATFVDLWSAPELLQQFADHAHVPALEAEAYRSYGRLEVAARWVVQTFRMPCILRVNSC